MTNQELSEMLQIYAKYALLSAATTFVAFVPGILNAENYEVGKAALLAALIGTGTGVARAIYGAIRKGELPFPNIGAGSGG